MTVKPALICTLLIASISLACSQQPVMGTAPKSISSYLGLHAFPAKNQTPDLQQQQEMACYNWGRQDSGFDPLAALAAQPSAPAVKSTPQAAAQKAGAQMKGAAGGAAAGGTVGAIAGDPAKGVEVGAMAGTIRGRAKAKRAEQQAAMQADQRQQAQAQQQAQEKAQTQQKLDGFKKGFSACMEAKGYVVK